MFKRIGVFALMVCAAGAVLTPATAFAQDGYGYGYANGYYGGNRAYYYDARDRDCDRHDRRDWRDYRYGERREEWRENERRERRAEEWRNHERRAERRDWR